MRESRNKHVHEYIATTPQYDKQGHKIFSTYYLQDSEGLMPVYRVTAIGRGQPQAPMHRQLVAGYKSQRSNPMSECSAQCTPVSHQQNQSHNVADRPSVHLVIHKSLSLAYGCGIDHWFPHCPNNLTMPLATCDQCGIDHLFPQCPRKSPNAQLTVQLAPRD